MNFNGLFGNNRFLMQLKVNTVCFGLMLSITWQHIIICFYNWTVYYFGAYGKNSKTEEYLWDFRVGNSQFSSVQSLSYDRLFVTPWTVISQAFLSITDTQSLLKFIFIESVMPSNHLILCCPLLLLLSIFPSIRVFSNEYILHIRWPKYWSFSFSISSSNEYSGLIFFRIDWFDLLAFQGFLKSVLQHHSSKTSIIWHSAFLIVHLSYSYMTTGKTIGLLIQTFIGKVMFLLFNMLSLS